MFGGTFAAKGGIRPASRFEYELEDPVLKRKLSHAYDVIVLPVRGDARADRGAKARDARRRFLSVQGLGFALQSTSNRTAFGRMDPGLRRWRPGMTN